MLPDQDSQPEIRYAIDLGWFRENNRSFATLASSRLCPKCQGQLQETAEAMLDRFSQHCSQAPGLFHPRQPLMEAIFRLFLTNGNRPMSPDEIADQLNMCRAGQSHPVDAMTLRRLLDSDRFYGIRPATRPVAEASPNT